MSKQESKLLNVQQSATFLGLNPATIRRWAKTNQLNGIKVGSRGDWRFTEEALSQLTRKPSIREEQRKFVKIKKLITENWDSIQKSATAHHTYLIGGDPLPPEHISKYKNLHTQMIKAIAHNLHDFEKGTTHFNILGVELAKEAVRDNLTIEEAVDGTIFMKQAIWKTLEKTGILNELSTQDVYEFSQIIGSYCDILASKIAFTYHNVLSEKISASEERFKALTEKSADAIAQVDRKGKVLYASSSTQEVLGYTQEELKKLNNPFELVPQNERIIITKIFAKILSKPGGIERVKYRVLHKGGHHIWVESVMTNLLSDPNIAAVVINYSDVTERTQSEDALKESEERLRIALEAGQIGVWDWNIQTNTFVWSDRVYEFYGVAKEDFDVTHENFSKYMFPDDRKRVEEAIKKALEGSEEYDIVSRIVSLEGKIKWLSSRAVVTRDSKGNPLRMLGATSDVTEQKKIEQDKNDFVSIATHELKTPVTSLKAYAEVMQKTFVRAGDTVSARNLGKMNSQLDKLTSLIGSMLDSIKIDSDKLLMREELFDFDSLVEEIVEEMQRTTEKHSISIRGKTKKSIYADRGRVGQILTNLLSNAIKYSPQSDSVLVQLSSNSKNITLSVKDFGMGISKKKQPFVFERFYRGVGPKEITFPGLGLGLYISREIVKKEGGKIWVKSIEGKGSTFSFSLPVKKQ